VCVCVCVCVCVRVSVCVCLNESIYLFIYPFFFYFEQIRCKMQITGMNFIDRFEDPDLSSFQIFCEYEVKFQLDLQDCFLSNDEISKPPKLILTNSGYPNNPKLYPH
jgi:hypothetical protein